LKEIQEGKPLNKVSPDELHPQQASGTGVTGPAKGATHDDIIDRLMDRLKKQAGARRTVEDDEDDEDEDAWK
jgi:hypothetical protein